MKMKKASEYIETVVGTARFARTVELKDAMSIMSIMDDFAESEIKSDKWIPITEGMPEDHKELLRTDADEVTPEQTYRLLVYTDCHSMTLARRIRMAIGAKEWVWMGGFCDETITHYQLAPAKPTSDVPVSLILDQIEKEN